MLDWLIRNAIAAALMPPGCLIILATAGLVVLRRRPRLGWTLLAAAILLLYALSTKFVADRLLHTLEPPAHNPLGGVSAQAIVVLGGGRYFSSPEYGSDTVNSDTLVRLRYAAHLHRATGKPILVSGGSPEGAREAEATLMAATLKRDFGVPVTWVEDRSHTTQENARFSHEILKRAGVNTVYLVTHAWHMPRSAQAFEQSGFAIIPAATGYATRLRYTLLDFLPNAQALLNSSRWFHEIVGIAWYRIKSAIAGDS